MILFRRVNDAFLHLNKDIIILFIHIFSLIVYARK